jgi:hypothetical protein
MLRLMKPAVVAAGAFAAGAVALGLWLLSRPRDAAETAESAEMRDPGAPGLDSLTFATWSSRSDGVLLVEMQPEGTHYSPKRFRVVDVTLAPDGGRTLAAGKFFSWAPEDRIQTTGALLDRGFPIQNDEYRPYVPSADPLSGEAPAGTETASEQTLVLRSKSGLTATLRRRRAGPESAIVWGKRALGFSSSDGRLAYVIPDKVILPIDVR